MNMVYITLDELKEILPDIFNAWMDDNDESWEWIFQEVEKKCHVGKGKKDKKQKKDDVGTLKNDISVLSDRSRELNKKVDEVIPKIMGDFDARINALTKRIDGLSNKVSNLSDKYITVSNDIRAAKLMAQTAKQRTEVDYTKCSKEKSDVDVIREVYNRMAGRGATREELDTFRNLIQKYDALEKKEIRVSHVLNGDDVEISQRPQGMPTFNREELEQALAYWYEHIEADNEEQRDGAVWCAINTIKYCIEHDSGYQKGGKEK